MHLDDSLRRRSLLPRLSGREKLIRLQSAEYMRDTCERNRNRLTVPKMLMMRSSASAIRRFCMSWDTKYASPLWPSCKLCSSGYAWDASESSDKEMAPWPPTRC